LNQNTDTPYRLHDRGPGALAQYQVIGPGIDVSNNSLAVAKSRVFQLNIAYAAGQKAAYESARAAIAKHGAKP